jgi:signal peptidase I
VTDYRKILQHNYVKTAIGIALVIAIVLGFIFGLGLALGTAVPLRVVESGSMCTGLGRCDGWSDVFDYTLHRGDIILIQGVQPEEINANYPSSDIIVYQNPENLSATPIVHRVVASYQVNGTWYFQTKGDGNGYHWPEPVSASDYDSNQFWFTGQGVPQNLVLGRVILRIPYFGWITLLLQNNNWILSLVIASIIALVMIEFVLPVIRAQRKKKKIKEQREHSLLP